MAGELIKLKREGAHYTLSGINRSYSRGVVFEGSISRAVTGRLNIRKRAMKTTHTISWSTLTYDAMPDGGLGLKDLEALVSSGLAYSLEVNRYPASGDWPEDFEVMFDPEDFSQSLVKLRGQGRRMWQVSVTLLEV